ncbi:PorT family protein [Sphingobacterium shayense]|uniref:porin family protein n=1 Tax=Sphingobacterium shayense TaxID=626343 RepID=UPI0015582F6E|nr:porin family protein [Sphingobacterium shayense]NQD71113.1 PorT family protein [Sphingobacterium shayense]
MKKNVVTFVFAISALILSSKVSAQDTPVSFGLKAGAGLSNYRLGGEMKRFKSKMNIGGSAGAFVKYDLSPNFALQTGLDVYYNISKLESKTERSTDKLKSFGVEVPVYGIVQGKLGTGNAFLGAGPYVGYGISAKANGINLFKKNDRTGSAMNRFDYGLGGIIGYDFKENWQINASYRFGLADLHKGKGGSMKSHGASIGIGYKF